MTRTIQPSFRRRWKHCLTGALALLGPWFACSARASDTQWWISSSASDLTRAEAHGVQVRPDGVITLGPSASSTPADSLGVIWAIVPMRDGAVALAGERGRVDRWTESGGVRPWVKLPVGQVMALAADGDGLIAGTGPEGLIYRIGARGDTSCVARTGERYVWGLAPGTRGSWYVATGTRGRLYRLTAGKLELALDTDESNLVSILADGAGGVYAGGDSHGRLMHVGVDGTARTVFDATEDEIRALAIGPDGALYAAALSGSPAVLMTAGSLPDASGEEDDKAAPASSAGAAGRAVVYRIVPDSSATTWWNASQQALFALARTAEGVLAGSGNRAGVYRVEPIGSATPLLMMPQGQVTALAVASSGRVYAATSNPGALWRLGPERAARGELLSAAFDARRTSRFGRLLWRGKEGGGGVELYSRSGNSDPPDTTWTPWNGGATPADGQRSAVPPARYLQWKLVLSGGNPEVESVEAAWRQINLPPRIEDIVIAPQGQGFREGEMLPRIEPITQVLPGGQKVEYSPPSQNLPKALRDLPGWARGLRTVQWRASDPNGDPMRFRVEERGEQGGPWIKIIDNLEIPSITWDTNQLPDGRYRVRVIASDSPGNALGEERTASAVSKPFTNDNTPPAITALTGVGEVGAVRLEGRAEDALSPLSRIEVAVDEEDWRPVSPDDGFTDDRRAAFHARLANLTPGEHIVSARAVDLSGNVATRAIRVTVPSVR